VNPSDKVDIEVPGVDILSGLPRKSFTSAIEDYARTVLKEASNLEAGERADKHGQREFHSKHVEKAARWVREQGIQTRTRSPWYVIGRIAQTLFTIFSGVAITFATAPRVHGLDGATYLRA
jgi:hypothetical protein